MTLDGGIDTPPTASVYREDVPLEEVLAMIHDAYGYDFRGYARSSLRRRFRYRATGEELVTLSALAQRIREDPACMDRLLGDLSISVTALFRDPSFYRAFRTAVVPMLRTYPFIRIWNAGCATGEEAYSVAIILEEEGLADRAIIYATDMSTSVLARAKAGIVPLDQMRTYSETYQRSGGTRAFSEYYTAAYGGARFRPALSRNIVFAEHNLVSDGSFNEFHVILCRNVLIYFGRELQDQVHTLFLDSLVRFGILALGSRESLAFNACADRYEALDVDQKLYRRVR